MPLVWGNSASGKTAKPNDSHVRVSTRVIKTMSELPNR